MPKTKKSRTRKRRKGVFEGLSNSALAFVILVIVVSLGAIVLDSFQNTTANDSQAFTIIGQGLTGLQTYGNFFTLIVTVVVIVAIFILILAGLQRFRGAPTSSGF